MKHLLPAALVVIALSAGRAAAQPLPPGTPVNPQAPNLLPVSPFGMQRGTSLEVTLTGTNLAFPTGVWTSFPAKVTIPTDAKNGTDNAKVRVKIEVPADAPLGFHALRLATTRGMSNTRLFCIDDLPQVLENDKNRSHKTAQAVPVPCVVVGRADAEVTDYFKFAVKAGQRLSFEVIGRRLGSNFDPQITLFDAAGNDLPGGHNNDAPGLQTDARLSYTFKTAGEYVLAIRDVSYRGGADFNYRLRIGDFPCATSPIPMAVKRGSKASVRFSGTALEGVAPVEVQAPNDLAVEAVQVAPRGPSGLHGWPVSLALSDLEERVEAEPNNDAKQANRVSVPGAITGRFEVADDVDHYVFTAKKGQRLILQAHTAEHGSPTEVYMILRNPKGAQVQATNPAAAPRLDYTVPDDGDYTISVEHLHAWGGPDEAYRLTITPYQTGFTVSVPIDRVDVAPGGQINLPLLVARAGYLGPLEATVVGPKGLSGTVTIPAGAPKAPNLPAATLPIKAADDLPPGPLTFRIQVKPVEGPKAKPDPKAKPNPKAKPKAPEPLPVGTFFASTQTALTRDLANLPNPPATLAHTLLIAVRERPPFTLALKLGTAVAPRGKPIIGAVTVTRIPGFTAEVVLTAIGLPPGVAMAPVKVLAGQSSAKVQFNVGKGVKPGAFAVTIQGQTTHMGRGFSASAAPVKVVVGK
jgi:hypothetical protein